MRDDDSTNDDSINDDSTNDAATMNWAHLWAEPMPIPMHALAALAATALGGVQLALPKRHALTSPAWHGVGGVDGVGGGVRVLDLRVAQLGAV